MAQAVVFCFKPLRPGKNRCRKQKSLDCASEVYIFKGESEGRRIKGDVGRIASPSPLYTIRVSLRCSVILTLYATFGKGDQMTFEQIVTYVILPIFAAVGAIWGTVKFIIPKVTDRVLRLIESRANAEIEGEKTTREYQQKMEQLEQSYLLSEASVAQQRMADLLEDSQGTLKTIYFDGIDKIKTDTSHLPLLVIEIKGLQTQINGLETRQRLLIGIITKDLTAGDERPTEDYDTWKQHQQPRSSQEDS